MSCQFTLPTTLSPIEINASASIALTNNGGTFTATETGGTFSVSIFLGTIAGSYNVTAGSIDVNITDKPWLISCGTIESELRKYVGGIT